MSTIAVKCVNCGGDLQISQETEQYICGYCGSQQRIHRNAGTIEIIMIKDAIGKVQGGTDKTAHELALVRLKSELASIDEVLENQHILWANRHNVEVKDQSPMSAGEFGIIVICSLLIVLSLAVIAVIIFWVGIDGYVPYLVGAIVVLFFSVKRGSVRDRAKWRGQKIEIQNAIKLLEEKRNLILAQIDKHMREIDGQLPDSQNSSH